VNRTKCEVELALDEFAFEELERVAGRLGVPCAKLVQNAVRHWLDEERAGRLAVWPSSFALPAASHPAVPVAVDLALSDWQAMRHAAGSRDVEPEALVVHALLLLLADVDSGRMAARVARSSNGMEP
jgi:hypothetical protein